MWARRSAWLDLSASLFLSEPGRHRARERGRNMQGSFALPDALLPIERDKRQSQRVQGSELIPPLSPPSCSPARQLVCGVMCFKVAGTWTHCDFQMLRLPLDTINDINPEHFTCQNVQIAVSRWELVHICMLRFYFVITTDYNTGTLLTKQPFI